MSPDAASLKQTDKHSTQSLQFIVRSGLAGGIAGCVAKTVVAPIDRVKILLQASNPEFHKYAGSWSGALSAGTKIYKEGGFRGLFQGHSATLLRIFPYAAIKYMAYDQVHYILMPSRQKETNVRRFLAGAISGTISVIFTYPLEVIRVRMAFQTRKVEGGGNYRPSFITAAKFMYQEGAAAHAPGAALTILDRYPSLKFYRGFTVTVVGIIPYAGVFFLSSGFLRSHFIIPSKSGHARPSPIADLTIGGISGAVAQTASYPFEVIRRRMQVGGITRPDRWLGWRETVTTIWKSSGWRGFYVGMGLGWLKIIPMNAVSFAVWQSGKRYLNV